MSGFWQNKTKIADFPQSTNARRKVKFNGQIQLSEVCFYYSITDTQGLALLERCIKS